MNMTAQEIGRFLRAVESLADAQQRLAAVGGQKMQPIRAYSHGSGLGGHEAARAATRDLHEAPYGYGSQER